MKLFIEIPDGHLSAIQKELRVTHVIYKQLIENPVAEIGAKGYALRILRVRRLLDLSMAPDEACLDYVAPKE